MANVVYSMMVSLDGFIETPNHEIDWIMIDDELHAFANDQARDMDAFLYGRRLYQIMVDYWPTADTQPSVPAVEVEFARIWKEKPKIVFSTTLQTVEWKSRLVRDNIAEEVATLKEQTGGDLGLGGANLAATFMRLDLIDEYRLIVHPIVLGGGTPFFPHLDRPIDLQLVETRTFGSGVVYLRYQRSGTGRQALRPNTDQ